MEQPVNQNGTRPVVVRETVIRNKEGLHFRPIMRLVDVLSRYRAQVTFHVDERKADARSPMELLMLVATNGTRLKLVGEGDDAEEAVEALLGLIDAGFDET